MAGKQVVRNRFAGRRLWDEQGREWRKRLGWLTHTEVDEGLKAGQRLGTHRQGEPVRWLTSAEARSWWRQAKVHAQSGQGPGEGPVPDSEGLTYAVAVWESNGEVLLVAEGFC